MLSTHHELLNLTSRDRGGGRTPNVHKCIIVPTPGMLQSCLFQRKNYDCKSALPTDLEEKMRMTTEIH